MFSKKPKLTDSTLTINLLDINPGDMFKFQNSPWTIIKNEFGDITLSYLGKSVYDSIRYVDEKHLIELLELLATVIHLRTKPEKK